MFLLKPSRWRNRFLTEPANINATAGNGAQATASATSSNRRCAMVSRPSDPPSVRCDYQGRAKKVFDPSLKPDPSPTFNGLRFDRFLGRANFADARENGRYAPERDTALQRQVEVDGDAGGVAPLC